MENASDQIPRSPKDITKDITILALAEEAVSAGELDRIVVDEIKDLFKESAAAAYTPRWQKPAKRNARIISR